MTQVLKELRETQGRQELLVRKVIQALKVPRVILGLLVRKDQKESKVTPLLILLHR